MRRPFVGPVGRQPKSLKAVLELIYGPQTEALLDSGALPCLMSTKLCGQLSLEPKDTSKAINVANGSSAVCKGILHDVPISFRSMSVTLDFHVNDGPHFDIVVGYTTFEKL